MSLETRSAVKWGTLLGVANLVWLYLSYYLGLHTSGLTIFQIVPLVWFLLTLGGYLLAFREIKRVKPTLRYGEGLRAGLVMAGITALIGVVMQVGYYTLIHPAWPEYMVGETRAYFTAQGLPASEVEQMVEQARTTFSLTSYATQSALSALVGGVVLSAIIMFFVRRQGRAPA